MDEVSTYRQQVRIKPLELPEALEHDLAERVPGARYLRTTATLNLDPGRVPGSELPALVEGGLLRAMGETESVATIGPVIPVPRLLRVLATLCVVVLFAACSNDPSSAATVGETGEISIDQLHADVALFGFLAKLSSAPCGTPVGNETQESACARFALANDIHEEVAKAYASENDVKVDPAAVTDALAQLEDGLGGADALKAQLSDAGVTRAQVEAFAGRLLLVSEVQKAVAKDRVDEAALRDAYQANLAQLTTVEVEHILVPTRRTRNGSPPRSRPRRSPRRPRRSRSIRVRPRRAAASGGRPPWPSSRRSSTRTSWRPPWPCSPARSRGRSRRSSAGT